MSVPLEYASFPGPLVEIHEVVKADKAPPSALPKGGKRGTVAAEKEEAGTASLLSDTDTGEAGMEMGETVPAAGDEAVKHSSLGGVKGLKVEIKLVERCIVDILTRSRNPELTGTFRRQMHAILQRHQTDFDENDQGLAETMTFSSPPSKAALGDLCREVLVTSGAAALTAVPAHLVEFNRMNEIGGQPTLQYRTIGNAELYTPLHKFIAVVKDGVRDEELDAAFAALVSADAELGKKWKWGGKQFTELYDPMVDYKTDEKPVKWPIAPVEKSVIEAKMVTLLAREDCAYLFEGEGFRMLLDEVLRKHQWNFADEMFDTPTVEWNAVAADLAGLLPAVDYDFQIKISVSHDGFVWSENFVKQLDEYTDKIKPESDSVVNAEKKNFTVAAALEPVEPAEPPLPSSAEEAKLAALQSKTLVSTPRLNKQGTTRISSASMGSSTGSVAQPVAAVPMMQVQVPAGAGGGQMVAIQTPTGMMQVQVPMGLWPGQMFQIQVPGPAPRMSSANMGGSGGSGSCTASAEASCSTPLLASAESSVSPGKKGKEKKTQAEIDQENSEKRVNASRLLAAIGNPMTPKGRVGEDTKPAELSAMKDAIRIGMQVRDGFCRWDKTKGEFQSKEGDKWKAVGKELQSLLVDQNTVLALKKLNSFKEWLLTMNSLLKPRAVKVSGEVTIWARDYTQLTKRQSVLLRTMDASARKGAHIGGKPEWIDEETEEKKTVHRQVVQSKARYYLLLTTYYLLLTTYYLLLTTYYCSWC